jgi:hypothetical protein
MALAIITVTTMLACDQAPSGRLTVPVLELTVAPVRDSRHQTPVASDACS